jgi:hypothetical protein
VAAAGAPAGHELDGVRVEPIVARDATSAALDACRAIIDQRAHEEAEQRCVAEEARRCARIRLRGRVREHSLEFDRLRPEAQAQTRAFLEERESELGFGFSTYLDRALRVVRRGDDPREEMSEWEERPADDRIDALKAVVKARLPRATSAQLRAFTQTLRALPRAALLSAEAARVQPRARESAPASPSSTSRSNEERGPPRRSRASAVGADEDGDEDDGPIAARAAVSAWSEASA